MVEKPYESDGDGDIQTLDNPAENTQDELDDKLKQPPRYAVVLHNDDYTTMEFVVEVLRRLFHKTEDEAMRIMLRIHHEGKGVAGVYPHEIAETKVVQVDQMSQARGFPLKCTLEPLK